MKLSTLPDDLKQEVIDFIDGLKERISGTSKPRKRKAGLAKGMIEMADDFDAPLDDFSNYM